MLISQARNIVTVLVAMESVLHQFTESFPPAPLKPGLLCASERKLHQAVKQIVTTWQKLLIKSLFPLVRVRVSLYQDFFPPLDFSFYCEFFK